MTKDLISTIPSDTQERKRLQGVINELVDSMMREADEKENQKTIVAVEKEDKDYCPKFIKYLAKMEFDNRYAAEKARRALEEKVEQLTELDILMGRSN
jgi:hypothetical protein